MTRDHLRAKFPHWSEDTIALNATDGAPAEAKPTRSPSHLPNKTEQRFLDILNAKQRRGELLSVRYEGMTLRWGGGMKYTADMVAQKPDGSWLLFEVKGAHIRSRDIVRFKGCRAEWPEFEFQMWQWKSGEWTRIY